MLSDKSCLILQRHIGRRGTVQIGQIAPQSRSTAQCLQYWLLSRFIMISMTPQVNKSFKAGIDISINIMSKAEIKKNANSNH